MPRRRPWWRRLLPRTPRDRVAAGIVAVVALTAAMDAVKAVARMLAAAWPVLLVLVLLASAAAAHRLRRAVVRRREAAERASRLCLPLARIDAMTDREFEFAARDLLLRDGCSKARQVGRQGDQAADVIAHHPRYGRIVVQCKHTRVGGKVGAQVMYQVKGTAGPAHRADVAVVVTNGALTRDAAAWGDTHRVHWIDRDRLRRWAEEGTAFGDLLGLPAARRGPLAARPAAEARPAR
ncbi:restriction endonuclease [Kitasatospora sp. NPDC059571]|uniref:restriction endonuclease n=1 Tax=Kitasatospora sp. NPDC059571 TaxID=3346871 RepID=UPI003685070D